MYVSRSRSHLPWLQLNLSLFPRLQETYTGTLDTMKHIGDVVDSLYEKVRSVFLSPFFSLSDRADMLTWSSADLSRTQLARPPSSHRRPQDCKAMVEPFLVLLVIPWRLRNM